MSPDTNSGTKGHKGDGMLKTVKHYCSFKGTLYICSVLVK